MKKKISRILSFLLAIALAVPATVTLTGCSPRNEVLRIYNWGDYIDENLIGEFERWYQRETGNYIEVEYDTFETNEDMLMRIEVLKSDYDLVCPSDYMAERMIKAGLAQKVNKNFINVAKDGFLYDGLLDMVKQFDPNNDYYVPYCWGTCGIMYDTNHIAAGSNEMKSWDAVWNKNYNEKILMKDSVRDAYSVARIYKNREKLSALSNNFQDYNEAYRAELTKYFKEISNDSINEAMHTLVDQKRVLYKYEVDDGKNDMLAGTTKAWLGMFWSCDVGLIMQEDAGDHFYYEVPKEGSNVWVDGWIIPKYAGNVTAANYFLKFINMYEKDEDGEVIEGKDYAMVNYDYMCTSMASKAVMEDAKASWEEDEDEFFANREEWFKDMFLEMMFPPPDVLARCAVMKDFGKKWATDLDGMWIDVKTM